MRLSQQNLILRHLKRYGKITVPQMMHHLCIANFTARISELRQKGFKITNNLKFDRKTKQYKSTYVLEKGA